MEGRGEKKVVEGKGRFGGKCYRNGGEREQSAVKGR